MKKVTHLLCGYERGGTTLLSEIFRANGYESGFECGVLLADQPKDMPALQPYWDMLLKGWNISEAARSKAASGDFSHFYDTICSEAFPGKGGKYFDKTPIYMSKLGRCMSRAPDLEGAVVIHRDPRAVFLSMATRISPKLDAVKAVEKNFDNLVAR